MIILVYINWKEQTNLVSEETTTPVYWDQKWILLFILEEPLHQTCKIKPLLNYTVLFKTDNRKCWGQKWFSCTIMHVKVQLHLLQKNFKNLHGRILINHLLVLISKTVVHPQVLKNWKTGRRILKKLILVYQSVMI